MEIAASSTFRMGVCGLAVLAAGSVAGCAAAPGATTQTRAGPGIPGTDPVTTAQRAGIPPRIAMGAIGHGMQRVLIMRRATTTGRQPLIVFFHGYGTATVAGQEPWLTHMAEGATVAWPVYDEAPFDGSTGAARMFPAAAAGLRVALARLQADKLVSTRQLVVGGYSLGGALAWDYAKAAARFDLPPPRALYAVFPGQGLCHHPARLPAQRGAIGQRARVLAIASPNDLLAGTCLARAIVNGAVNVPADHKQLRLVSDYWLGDHFAPTRTGPREHQTFWRPLDRLLAGVVAR